MNEKVKWMSKETFVPDHMEKLSYSKSVKRKGGQRYTTHTCPIALGFLKLVPDPLIFDHNPIALLLHMV